MRFDIDYAQAKTIATRLQDFLSENPKPKLSRSSSVEAVARMLGFNNRNEMKARLEAETAQPENAAQATGLDKLDPAALAKGIEKALSAYSAQQRQDCAARIVKTAQGISPEKPFWQAIHDDDDGEQIHALLIVEDEIIDQVRRDPSYRQLLLAILSSSEEYLGAYAESPDIDRALARALVNEALPIAEALWDVPSQDAGEEDDWSQAFDHAAIQLEAAIRKGAESVDALFTEANKIIQAFGKPPRDALEAIRDAFLARFGLSVDDYDEKNAQRPWHGWDVDVSCWVPATREIDLEFGESHTIETEVLHLATIQVDAADEEHALARARARLENEDFSMIWNARPDRGSRNLRGRDQDGNALSPEVVRDYAGWDDDWQYDLSGARQFSADQIAF